MRVFIIFLVCGYFSVIISSRPTIEGNDRETSDAEYEDSDDSHEDEDLSEDQEPASNEAQIRTINQPQEFNHNIREERIDQNKARYKVSDPEFDVGKEPRQDQINLNVQNQDGFSVQSGNPKTYHNDINKEAEANEELRENPRLEARDMNSRQNSNYPSDAFIKINSENLNVARRDYNNEHLDRNEQPTFIKKYYSTLQTRNKDIVDRTKYDNSCYTRDRRETQSLNSRENNGDINESSEISILKNIKMLSDKDLENLLNSLPEDKKALLRKIMDKREITKKAGAVDDNGFDTSKLEGSYSIDSNTFSSLSTNTDASDTIKHSESEESSTKPQENENDAGKSENKSGLIANKNEQTFEVSVEAVTSNKDSRNDANIVKTETSKSDNKREINSDLDKKDVSLEDTKLGDDLNDKRSYDSLIDDDVICSDNKGWFDSETDGSNTQKREVLQDNSFADKDSIKSLEDSFPSAYGYEDINLNSEPLIRVKRTELKHRVKKRDLPPLINDKVPFVPVFEDKEPENVEVSEFEDKSFLNHAAVNVREDREVKSNKANLVLKTGLNDNSELVKVGTDESSIGSDTDSILSNDEEAGDNIMYNNKIRNKRLNENTEHEENNKKLIRSGRTITPIDNESNLKSDNSIDTPQYHGEESFGTISHNSEEDLSRSKRIKRVKNVLEIS